MRFLLQLLFFFALGIVFKELGRALLGSKSKGARRTVPGRSPKRPARDLGKAIDAEFEVIEDD